MTISISSSGSFKNTQRFLKYMSKMDIRSILNKYGEKGVKALNQVTPTQTGRTAASWSYTVEATRGTYSIAWTNDVMAGEVPLVILLQYGHGTGTGGYVAGRDFINPAIQPIFDQIASDVWKEVKRA